QASERMVDQAYSLYRSRDPRTHPRTGALAQQFRRCYSHEAHVYFIGVWDTVGELGMPTGIPVIPRRLTRLINQRWSFHDVKLSTTVRYAYHALAIDERRRQFEPTLWEQQPKAIIRSHHGTPPPAPESQTMEQVWFAGVHSNVGGGYPDTGLS